MRRRAILWMLSTQPLVSGRHPGTTTSKGFFLNNQNAKIRGFCHDDDFTGVGMAVPDRIWLLTAMQNRGIGANAWRMSHNNYRGSVYDIADATGTLVYDENRDLRVTGLEAMAKMIKAHRNHHSIFAYSLCNEGECDFHGQDPPGKPGSGKHNQTVYALFRRGRRPWSCLSTAKVLGASPTKSGWGGQPGM